MGYSYTVCLCASVCVPQCGVHFLGGFKYESQSVLCLSTISCSLLGFVYFLLLNIYSSSLSLSLNANSTYHETLTMRVFALWILEKRVCVITQFSLSFSFNDGDDNAEKSLGESE